MVLVDDHALVRESLALLLGDQPDIDVVGEAGTLASAMASVAAERPTVLVLDLSLPDGWGVTAIPDLLRSSPETAILVLTMQGDPAYAPEATRAGALGYMVKESAGADLVAAVRAVAGGERWPSPGLGAELAAGGEDAPAPDDLSEREVKVLELIALGHTNAEIGDSMGLSVRTIESHRARIQRKLGRSTRSELVGYAFEHGLVDRLLAPRPSAIVQ